MHPLRPFRQFIHLWSRTAKMLGRIGLLLLVIASCYCNPASCQSAGRECLIGVCGAVASEIDEPVFGYSYFASQASFKRIRSESLRSTCLDLARRRFFIDGKVSPWLYLDGDYQNGDTHVAIVGHSGGTSIFVRRGQSCAIGGVALTLLQRHHNPPMPNDPPYLSRHEIDGVFTDLLRRYASAFGSKANFFGWLDPLTNSGLDQCRGMSHAYCHPTWHDLPPDLQEMLERFRSKGGS